MDGVLGVDALPSPIGVFGCDCAIEKTLKKDCNF